MAQDNNALTPSEIKIIQQCLITLGFLLVGKVDGELGLNTANAIREFQIYASMPFVAKESSQGVNYIDRLTPVKNTAIYLGPISGQLNAATKQLLSYWQAQQWRCPVVIYAKNTNNMPDNINLWAYDEPVLEKLTIYARDFSGYYLPITETPVESIVGQMENIPAQQYSGPVALPKHCSAATKMTIENWLGQPSHLISPEQLSTYKVILGTAQAECYGYFDCINGYDNAFISFGPCHWTLAIAPPVTEGELCGYFAYLAYAYPEDFKKMLGNFGVSIDKKWLSANGHANGADLFNSSLKKYTAWILLQGENQYSPLPHTIPALNYFRNWHWFYRFRMATKLNHGCQQAMWEMACIRIKDILSTPHPLASARFGTALTLGDIYTSEQAVAMILRWHVRYPADIVQQGQAAERVQAAFMNLSLPSSLKTWGNYEESELIEGLWQQVIARNNPIISQEMQRIKIAMGLSNLRDSFRFVGDIDK